jgi:hypothetical protein
MLRNAVSSLIAEILALEIRKQLLDKPKRRNLCLLPPRRASVPPPERLKPLPKKYKELIGDHPDHPGEGRGRGVAKLAAPRVSLIRNTESRCALHFHLVARIPRPPACPTQALTMRQARRGV